MKQIIFHLGFLDLFRKPLHFRIEQQEMTSTAFGLLLSFVIYGFLSFSFLQSEFFLKTKPKIITQSNSLTYAPSITYQDRPFAFAITDITGESYLNPTLFSITITMITKNASKSGVVLTQEEKSFHLCNEGDFNYFNDITNLRGLNCLDDNEFTIYGDNTDPLSGILQLNVLMCQNSSINNNSCQPQEQIDKFFNMKNLKILYMNTIFQLQNYDSPITQQFSSTLYKLDPNLSRLISYYFQTAYVTTDETIFFSAENTIESWAYESENSEIGFSTNSDTPVATLLIYSSNNQLIQNRSYQTLPEAFAVLGGLFSFFVLCGKIFSKIDKNIYLTTLLMNNLYSFQQQTSKTVSLKNRMAIFFSKFCLKNLYKI